MIRSSRSRSPRITVSRGKSWWYYLLTAVILIGSLLGFSLPKLSSSIARTTGSNTATGEAADILQTLVVNDHPRPTSYYNREYFGFRETDEDGDGCNVREDVLARDLTNVQYKYRNSCKVLSGTLHDPYTGKTIEFHRGAQTSDAVQIDHVVALSDAWNSGAYQWSTAQRYKFGNDMYNLLAVDGQANQDKEDASADEWLPQNSDYDCSYVARQIGVKAKYKLSVTTAEKNAMLTVLHECPAQKIP